MLVIYPFRDSLFSSDAARSEETTKVMSSYTRISSAYIAFCILLSFRLSDLLFLSTSNPNADTEPIAAPIVVVMQAVTIITRHSVCWRSITGTTSINKSMAELPEASLHFQEVHLP